MLTKQKEEIKKMKIEIACGLWLFNNSYHSNNDEQEFHRILKEFLELDPDKNHKWLAGQLNISPASILRFAQGQQAHPLIRNFIIQTIEDEISS